VVSQWDFGRLSAFLEEIMHGAEQVRNWLQTQDAKDLDHAELFRLHDVLGRDLESWKRLVKQLRRTRR
jgi:hypothetical protein